MTTRIDEIADNIFRISTFVPEAAPPVGFTFNQFLVVDEQPLLFHCGMRGIFPLVKEAMEKVMPASRLRWIAFGHFEADECGAMNEWLAVAPDAQIMHGEIGCMVSVGDMADRPPRALADGETIATGNKRFRYAYTPHVPHGWDAGVLFEESTKTLFCGDILTHLGNGEPLVETDVVGAAIEAENAFHANAVTPQSATLLRHLADFAPETLAIMHGSSFRGDGANALRECANDFERRLKAET